MKRGDLYRVEKPPGQDPKRFRVFVVVSRQGHINSRLSSVVCAPVFTSFHGLGSQVPVGIDEGLVHDSSIHCDELVSLPKAMLTNYIGSLTPDKINTLNQALKIALEIPD